jgi:hypothetical protein
LHAGCCPAFQGTFLQNAVVLSRDLLASHIDPSRLIFGQTRNEGINALSHRISHFVIFMLISYRQY